MAYVRFASVYKGFDDPADFDREVNLLTKATDPSGEPLRRAGRLPVGSAFGDALGRTAGRATRRR